MDSAIDTLYGACATLGLIGHAADSVATGDVSDPAQLAGFIRQASFSLSEAIGAAIDILEVAQRGGE